MTETDWTAPGSKVAEHIISRSGRNGAVTVQVVDRIDRGYVVLDNGRRYHRQTLLPAKNNMGMSASYMVLRPLDDPDVRRDLAAHAYESLTLRAGQLKLNGFADPDAVLFALAEVEATIAEIRATIADPTRNA